MKTERDILLPFARDLAKKITRECVSFFEETSATLSGNDSQLNNVWEEICVQVQGEESFCWDAYDDTVRSLISGYVKKLKVHEALALWYLTEGYYEWDQESEDEEPPVYDGDIIDYIAQYFYEEAVNHTSDTIEAYKYGYDLDCEEDDYEEEDDESCYGEEPDDYTDGLNNNE